MNGNVNIRTVYLADFPQHIELIAGWAFNTWGRYNAAYTLEKRIESFTMHAGKVRLPMTLLALDAADKPIAMASLREDDGLHDGSGPWLGSVYTVPEYRSRGLGRHMCRAIETEAQTLGFKKIFLLTYENSLPDWYKKQGWLVIGANNCHGNPVTVMERRLETAR